MLRKILLVLSTIVLLAGILAGVAWWRLNDESWVERRLEAAVRESTGRELEVAGGLSLDLGRTTRLEVNDLALSNVGWAGDEVMLRAERLALALDMPALLEGRLEVLEFEMSGCRMRLAENAAGETNWNLLPEPPADADANADAVDGDGWDIAVQHLRIRDCRLSHDAPSRAQPVMLELTDATLELTADLHYRGSADGRLDGQAFRLEGSAGPVDALVRGGRFEHDLSLQAGDITLTSEGSVAELSRLADPNLSLRFRGPEFREVTRYLTLPPVSEGAFDFDARLTTADGSTTIDVAGDLGSLELRASGAVDRLLRPDTGELTLQFHGPDLGAVARAVGIEGVSPQPFRLEARARFEDGRTELAPMSLHTDLDQLDIEGRIGAWPGLEDSALKLKLWSSDPGRWGPAFRREGQVIEVDEASLSLGDDVFRGTATIDLRNGFSGSRLELAGEGEDWTVLAPRPDWLGLPGAYHVEVRYRREPDAHVVERLDLALGAFTLGLEGEVREVADGIGAELVVQAAGPDAAALHPALQELFAGDSFEAGSRLRGAPADFRLDDLSLEVGGSRVNGGLRVRRGERVRISGAIDAPLIDLGPALERPEPPDEEQGTGWVFEDVPISGYLPAGTDLDVDVSIETIDLGNSTLQDFAAGVSLEGSVLRLDPLEVRGPQGAAATGRLELDARPDRHRVEGALAGQGLRFNLMAAEGQPVESYPPIDVDLRFSGAGATLRAVAASLDGSLRLYQGEGRIANTRVTLLFSDFLSELFRLVNPFSDGSEYTELECSVIAAEAADGKVEVAPVVVRTRELTVLADGVIDLDTETIDVQFNMRPRGGIGVSAGNLVNSFVKVGGTLSDPAVELDPAKAVISGGAAVATAGLSLLARPLLDRFLGGADPCEAARRQLAERDAAD